MKATVETDRGTYECEGFQKAETQQGGVITLKWLDTKTVPWFFGLFESEEMVWESTVVLSPNEYNRVTFGQEDNHDRHIETMKQAVENEDS